MENRPEYEDTGPQAQPSSRKSTERYPRAINGTAKIDNVIKLLKEYAGLPDASVSVVLFNPNGREAASRVTLSELRERWERHLQGREKG